MNDLKCNVCGNLYEKSDKQIPAEENVTPKTQEKLDKGVVDVLQNMILTNEIVLGRRTDE